MKITYELLPTYSERIAMPVGRKEIPVYLTVHPSQLEPNIQVWTETMNCKQNRQGTREFLWTPKNNDIPCASAALHSSPQNHYTALVLAIVPSNQGDWYLASV